MLLRGLCFSFSRCNIPMDCNNRCFILVFPVPVSSTTGGPVYRIVGPNQTNPSQGMGSASTSGTMKSSAFDLLGSSKPQGHMQQQGFDLMSPSMPSNLAPIRFSPRNYIKQLQVKNVPDQFGMDTRSHFVAEIVGLMEHEFQMPLERRGVKLLQSFAVHRAQAHRRHGADAIFFCLLKDTARC